MEHDWTALKTEYVTGRMSYRELAETHGISVKLLQAEGTKGGWVKERKKHRQKIYEKAVQMASTKNATHLASLMRSADKMAGQIERALQDENQFYRYVVSEGLGAGVSETKEMVLQKADTRAIKDMVSSLKELTGTIRNLYDIPTLAEKNAREMAAKRFALEEKKAQSNDTDEGILLEMEGIPEEYKG